MANPKFSQNNNENKLERMSELAKLTRLAIGYKKNETFANECGLSTSVISRLLNCKLPAIPSTKTLIKIARASEGRVTYEQLLIAAGYEVDETSIELFQNATKTDIKVSKPTCIISDDVIQICKEIGRLIEFSGTTTPTAIVLAKKLSTLTALQQLFQSHENIIIQYALMLD